MHPDILTSRDNGNPWQTPEIPYGACKELDAEEALCRTEDEPDFHTDYTPPRGYEIAGIILRGPAMSEVIDRLCHPAKYEEQDSFSYVDVFDVKIKSISGITNQLIPAATRGLSKVKITGVKRQGESETSYIVSGLCYVHDKPSLGTSHDIRQSINRDWYGRFKACYSEHSHKTNIYFKAK